LGVFAEDDCPLAGSGDGLQAVETGRQLLPLDLHRGTEGDRGVFVGAGAPDFLVRHQAAPDGAALHARSAVVQNHLGDADGLRQAGVGTGARHGQRLLLGRDRRGGEGRQDGGEQGLSHGSLLAWKISEDAGRRAARSRRPPPPPVQRSRRRPARPIPGDAGGPVRRSPGCGRAGR